jgi:beta-glucosidase/6-phospho-beta-glucosidase/beta-galactosidase
LPVYVTENGIADASDSKRVRYLLGYLGELHRAVSEDGVPVRGYFHWTLMDSYEWNKGLGTRFGLYSVDRATKKRIHTKAVPVYKKICSSNSLP